MRAKEWWSKELLALLANKHKNQDSWDEFVVQVLNAIRCRELAEYNTKTGLVVPTRFCDVNIAFFDLDKESGVVPRQPISRIPFSNFWCFLEHSVNVISIKVAESDVGYPIYVYGTVLARDQYDYRCIYLFKRGMDNPQLINVGYFFVTVRSTRIPEIRGSILIPLISESAPTESDFPAVIVRQREQTLGLGPGPTVLFKQEAVPPKRHPSRFPKFPGTLPPYTDHSDALEGLEARAPPAGQSRWRPEGRRHPPKSLKERLRYKPDVALNTESYTASPAFTVAMDNTTAGIKTGSDPILLPH
ncbi:hypothetical protein HU200_014865 [Digitaria exilis]|uniref:DUF6598 domain-containing protein n=1 Tax=Digitaria exilis TaxID=1010633 RepID=A0A835KIL2_9POAL|nr:hypothetical protein HU200_014865 [Digitaria exilis]